MKLVHSGAQPFRSASFLFESILNRNLCEFEHNNYDETIFIPQHNYSFFPRRASRGHTFTKRILFADSLGNKRMKSINQMLRSVNSNFASLNGKQWSLRRFDHIASFCRSSCGCLIHSVAKNGIEQSIARHFTNRRSSDQRTQLPKAKFLEPQSLRNEGESSVSVRSIVLNAATRLNDREKQCRDHTRFNTSTLRQTSASCCKFCSVLRLQDTLLPPP